MTASISEHVITLLASHLDWPAERLTADKQLFDDLGLDGDDAVEFFEAFDTQFRADLSPLYANWSRHFGPEGIPLGAAVPFVVIGTLILMVTVTLGIWLNAPDWAGVTLGGIAVAVWSFGLRQWPLKRPEPMIPITVAQLITAANTGTWPIRYVQ
ncbi:hypothetical protein [Brevundimonas sp.]